MKNLVNDINLRIKKSSSWGRGFFGGDLTFFRDTIMDILILNHLSQYLKTTNIYLL
jgi:hypothetical protein